MTIDKYTSIKPVLERVYADTGFQFEIPHDDLILWTAECMELIGYPLQYVPKIVGYKNDSSYDFTNYRIELPCDFHKLQAIAVNGYPAYYASNTMHYLLDGACCGLNALTASQEDQFIIQATGENTPEVIYSPQASPISGPTQVDTATTFSINDNYITFNRETGKACIAYWAFPIDEDGFPIIPDDAKYRRAVQDYLIYKIDYRLWRQQAIPKDVFEKSETNWLWSIGSVSAHLKMPSLEQMEVIKSSLIRLIPKFHSYQNFFSDLATNPNRL
jgi:hypothetical protein